MLDIDIPAHPGKALAEHLQATGKSITEIAQHLGISRKVLSQIINCKAGISPDMAVKLSAALGATPEYWYDLQKNFELWQAKNRVDISRITKLSEAFPAVAPDTTQQDSKTGIEDVPALSDEIGFRSIFNQTSVGIAQVDLTGRFVLVNDQYCKLVGRSKEELYQIRMQDISHQEDVPGNMNLFKRAIQEGVPFVIEKRYTRPDNTQVWVRNNVSPVKNKEGKPIYVVAISQDITERKQAEVYHKLFLTMCENSSDFVGIATPDGQAFYLNPAGRKMVGLNSLEEVQQTQVLHYFLEEDKPFVKEVILPALWDKGQWVGDYRFRNFQTGKAIPVHYNQFLVKDPATGEILGIAAVSQDITEAKQAEEALKESEARFRTIADSSPSMIWMMDEHGRMTYFNKTFLQYIGLPEDYKDVIPRELYVPEEEEEFLQGAMAKAFIARKAFRTEHRLKRYDGDLRWFIISGNPRMIDGEFKGFIGSNVDITDHKLAEEALKESEERFRAMADNISQLVWMANGEGWIYWYNKRWYEFTGIDFEQMQGWGWKTVHHPEHIDRVITFVSEAWQKGEPWEMEFPLRRNDGEYRWFLTRAVPILNEEQQVVHWFGTNTDITDQKIFTEQLELKNAQLTRINNDLDNFIYIASHDLKSPVNNIEGLVNALNKYLGEETKSNPKIKTFIAMLYESIDRFKYTIKDLTEVAKIQSEGEEDIAQVSLKELLEEVKLNIRNQIEESQALIIDDFSQAPWICFSIKNLRSILYNLVSNAIKYRSPQHQAVIHITSSMVDEAHVLLSIQDNGLGIKPEDKAKIFMMFKRLHQHVEGTGIGLAIVKKIIDNNGGKIEVESEEGKGTLFKVYLKNQHLATGAN